MLIETGNVQRAREIADEFVRRHPDNSGGVRMLGSAMVAQGRLDEARAAFEKSEAMDPLDFGSRIGTRAVALLQERWTDAQAVNEAFARARAPFERFQSLLGESLIAAVHGKGQAARDLLDRAARVPGLSAQQRAASRNRLAMMLLRQGQPALALAQAELALVDARNRENEFLTLQLLSIAQSAIGRTAESARTLAQLEARAKVLPSEREVRRVHWTRGEIAALHGDTVTASAELGKATAMLPALGPPLGPPSSHPDLLYATALAAIRTGRDAEAAQCLERIQSSHDHIYAPDPWARSFFLLGRMYERRGDAARAREQYTHFLNLWRDGDLERGWVTEAQQKVTR
jgi:tetratricopeptide (TPR) repeat protein